MTPTQTESGRDHLAFAQKLLDLTRERRFGEVVNEWKAADVRDREIEVCKRLAAAAFAQSGDLAAARELLLELLSRTDIEAATCALAARVLFDTGATDASLAAWERAVSLAPANLGWWKWFAETSIRANQPERALVGAETHALHREQNVEIALAHATLLAKAHRSDEALFAFERLMALWPAHPVAGATFAQFAMREFPLQARELLDKRPWRPQPVTLSPELVRTAVALPAFFENETAAAEWRSCLLDQLKKLTELARTSPLRGADRASCLAATPFFAGFHDADITPIQFAWGDFVEALVAPIRSALPTVVEKGGPARKIGIVSNRFTDSSAGRFFNSWVEQLLATGYDVRLYALGMSDHETDRLSRLTPTERYAHDDPGYFLPLAHKLLTDQNDVLLFPEPQGSALITLVAGLRCAPIQCAAFGNPVTTGLHTMDFFLVPDAAEVAEPAAFYREKVARLAGIGIAFSDVPSAPRFDRQSFGFSPEERIYLVNQQLQKWSPHFVNAILDILRRDKQGRLVFFGIGSNVSTRAARRYLRETFQAQGVDLAARSTFLPGLDRVNFLALNAASDVSLDTLGYGGGSTTLDALGVGLPVITVQGRFLRSRQTAGMLRLAGSEQYICSDAASFVEAALATAHERKRVRGSTIIASETNRAVSNHSMAERPIIFADLAAFLGSL